MDSKKPWQSKTIVLNALLGLAAFAVLFFPAAAGLKPFIDAHASEIGMAWGILNMVLRAVTKDKIGLGD